MLLKSVLRKREDTLWSEVKGISKIKRLGRDISFSKEESHSWALPLSRDFRDFGIYPKNMGNPLKHWDDVNSFVVLKVSFWQ